MDQPQFIGSKTVLKLTMRNSFTNAIESARTAIFLLDDQGNKNPLKILNPMSFYPDLSVYDYFEDYYRPITLNIGWLDTSHPYAKAKPAKWVVEKLWAHCQYAIAQARGSHGCLLPKCSGPFENVERIRMDLERARLARERLLRWKRRPPKNLTRDDVRELEKTWRMYKTPFKRLYAKRPGNKLRLRLGSAEIRVFGSRGKIYAAPNLIYHYVVEHRYNPPAQFLLALKNGPCPPEQKYFERLKALDLEWSRTSSNVPDSSNEDERAWAEESTADLCRACLDAALKTVGPLP